MNDMTLSSLRNQFGEATTPKIELGKEIDTQISTEAEGMLEAIQITENVELPLPPVQATDAPPPLHIGQIRVWEAKSGRYCIEWSAVIDGIPIVGNLEDKDEGIYLPTMSLRDDLGRPGKSTNRETFYKKIYLFSESLFTKLKDWLSQLDAHTVQAKKPYSLVILEHTPFQFPWEMIEFLSHQQRSKRLGTAFTVTRWVETARLKKIPYTSLAKVVSGKVLPYVDKSVNRQAEKTLFSNYLRDRPILETTKEIIETLRDPSNWFGLIYFGCHAKFNESEDEDETEWLLLGHAHDRDCQLSNYQWSREAAMLTSLKRTIVFFNACHSGILSKAKLNYKEHEQRMWQEISLDQSFPVTSLYNGASGVIATLGFVDDQTFAPDILERLMAFLERGEDITVAEALRQLREEEHEAILNLGRDPTHHELLNFMCAFMYVYYGSPTTTLKIEKDEA
jgi:hypothetical protein